MPTDLSPMQLEFIEWFCDPRSRVEKGSQAAFAREHNVTEETVRRWKKTEWFTERTEQRLREEALGEDSLWEVVRAAKTKALDGDVQAMKVYQQFSDRLNPPKIRVDDGDLKGLTTDELLALLAGPIE